MVRSPAMTANVGTEERKNVSRWSLPMIMATSGLVWSKVLPSSPMAAISASSCLGSSLGGRVNNCGACTVAIAATICPMVSLPPCGLGILVYEFNAQFHQLRAQSVKIKPQLAGAQPSAAPFFLGDSLLTGLSHLPGLLAGYHYHAVGIGYDYIAWIDHSAGADHRDIYVARRAFDRTLGRDRLRPHRKTHGGELGCVSHAGVYDQPRDPVCLTRHAQQFTEHAVGRLRGR